MIRASRDHASRGVAIVVVPGVGAVVRVRSATGGRARVAGTLALWPRPASSRHVKGRGAGIMARVGPPVWVELVWRGAIVTAYVSRAGGAWVRVGEGHVALQRAAYLGIAVAAPGARGLGTAVFDHVVVSAPARAGGGRTVTGGVTVRTAATIKVGACCASSVAWAPDGKTLAVGVNATVRLVRRDGKGQATLTGPTRPITAVARSPDGRTVAAASRDRTIEVWRSTGRRLAVMRGHTAAVTSIVWSPGGTVLASASADGTVRLWQPNGVSLAMLFRGSRPVTSLAWSPNGQEVVFAAGDQVWIEGTGGRVLTILSHTGGATGVA